MKKEQEQKDKRQSVRGWWKQTLRGKPAEREYDTLPKRERRLQRKVGRTRKRTRN